MAQESVSLVVDLRDQATADLDKVNKKVRSTEKVVKSTAKGTDRSTQTMGSAFERFSGRSSKAFGRFTGGMTKQMGAGRKAMGRFTETVAGSDTRLGKLAQSGRQSMRNLSSGFKDSNAAASTFSGRMGTLGGAFRKVSDRAKKLGSSAASGIGTMRDGLGKAAGLGGKVAGGLGKVTSAAGRAGGAITSKVSSALSGAVSTAGKIGTVLGGVVAAAGIGGGVSRAMNLEDTEARLRGIGRSGKEIDSVMTDAEAAVQGTSYRMDEAAGVAATFSTAGVEGGEEMQRMLSLVGDNAFAAGSSFEEMGQIWGRVASYGALDTETMNQMMDRQIPILDGLSDHYGATKDEVREMVSEGKVSLEDFATVMEDTVGGAAGQMANTTRGAVSNVSAGLMMLGEQAVTPLMELFRGSFNALQEVLFATVEVVTPVFEVLTERAEAWAEGFADTGVGAAETIRGLVEPMEKVADLMRDGTPMVEAFAEAFDIDTSDGLLGGLMDMVGLASDLSPITGILKGIAGAGGDVGSAFGDAFGAIMDTLGEIAPQIGEAFAGIGEAVAPLIATLAENFAGLLEAVLPTVMEIVGVVADLLAELMPIITEISGVLVDVLLSAFEAILPALMPVIDVIADLASTLAPVLATLVEALAPVVSMVAELATVVLEALTPVLEPVASLIETVALFAVDLVTALMPLVEVVLEVGVTLLEALMPAISAIIAVVAPLLELFLDLLMAVLEPILPVITDLATILGDVLIWALELITPALEWVADNLDDMGAAADKAGDWFATAFDWIAEKATWLWQEILQPAWAGIKEAMAPVVDWFVETAWPWLRDAFVWIGEKATWLWHEVLRPAWDGIKAAAKVAVDWFMETAWPWLSDVFTWIGEKATWLWNDVLSPAWDGIKAGFEVAVDAISWYWENVLSPVISTIGDIIMWLWHNVAKPAWEGIKLGFSLLVDGISWYWENVLSPVISAVGDIFTWLWEDVLSPTFGWISDKWQWLSDKFSEIWENKIEPVLSGLGEFIRDDLVPMVEEGLDLISDAWEGIKEAFSDPVQFVVDTVWNNGLRKAWNTVAGLVGMEELDEIEFDAYAKGGRTREGLALVGEEGPELVHMPGGAHVSTANETRDILTQKLVDTGQDVPEEHEKTLIGKQPSESLLPIGGLWSDVTGGISDGISAVGDFVGDLTGWAVGGLVEKATETVFEPVMDTVGETVGGMGAMGDLITGFAKKAIDGLTGVFRDEDSKGSGGSGAGIGAAQFEGVRGTTHRISEGPVTSRYGPRAGGHHAGIDIAGGGPVFAPWNGRVVATGPNIGPGRTGNGILLSHGESMWSYFGHNPNGGTTVSPGDEVAGGQRIGAQGATGNVTGIHTHAEIHKGSPWNDVNPAPYLLRDQGGMLPPGLSRVLNDTGAPEWVFNQEQIAAMAEALDAPHLPADLTPADTATGGGGGGATVIEKRHVTVAEGAVQINVEAGPDGGMTEEALEQLREAIEDIFEESERRS